MTWPVVPTMSDAATHRRMAEEALAAAEELHPTKPVWALVPLFYSAMHLVHALFDHDALPDDQRHPERHRSLRDQLGTAKWGTQDVVHQRYPEISNDYRSLSTASRVVRYSGVVISNTTRFWDEYNRVAIRAGSRVSRRS